MSTPSLEALLLILAGLVYAAVADWLFVYTLRHSRNILVQTPKGRRFMALLCVVWPFTWVPIYLRFAIPKWYRRLRRFSL